MNKKMLGIRIKELRTVKGITQLKLAEIVDVDPNHMSRVEIGANYPSLALLEKLANALNVDCKDFFEFTPTPKNTKEIKKEINLLIKGADDLSQLRLAFKILKTIFR